MLIMSVLRHIQQYSIYIFVICLEIYRSGASDTFINTFLLYDLIFFVFNATFSNISAISWRAVLVVEEAGEPRENHRPWASNW